MLAEAMNTYLANGGKTQQVPVGQVVIKSGQQLMHMSGRVKNGSRHQ